MKPNKKDVHKSYEKIAQWFDAHRSRDLFEKPYLDQVVAHLKPGAKILDLGCGMGEPIAEYFIHRGFSITGIDGSSKLIKLARARFPGSSFLVHDMRTLDLKEKFDALILWHSLFHLTPSDQRAMFRVFQKHLDSGGLLLFTEGGPDEGGEIWSDNGGELLYHAILPSSEYRSLLNEHGFEVLLHVVDDKECGNATVWMARLKEGDRF